MNKGFEWHLADETPNEGSYVIVFSKGGFYSIKRYAPGYTKRGSTRDVPIGYLLEHREEFSIKECTFCGLSSNDIYCWAYIPELPQAIKDFVEGKAETIRQIRDLKKKVKEMDSKFGGSTT